MFSLIIGLKNPLVVLLRAALCLSLQFLDLPEFEHINGNSQILVRSCAFRSVTGLGRSNFSFLQLNMPSNQDLWEVGDYRGFSRSTYHAA